jgi:serine/threonine protein phosphatase PrpC
MSKIGIPIYKVASSLLPEEAKATEFDFFNTEKNVVTKFAFATRGGFQPQNPRKVNQDAFLLAPNMLHHNALHLFGICDGHGQYGHLVSAFIKKHLPSQLENQIHPNSKSIPEALISSFLTVNSGICSSKKFDAKLSGTTCCMVMTHGNKIYTANAGDSRAIIVAEKGSDLNVR